jgi:SH3-like domain-containing protein
LVFFIFLSGYLVKKEANRKSNQELPFFISTKNLETNLRSGPDKEYPIIIVYKKNNIPLKVIDIHNEWYQISDINNNTGWIYKNLTSSKKTAIIKLRASVFENNTVASDKIGVINPNNIVEIIGCAKKEPLCKIRIFIKKDNKEIKAWVEKINLWGAID